MNSIIGYFKKPVYQESFVNRSFAASIVVVATLTLLTRLLLRIEMGETPVEALGYMTQFFTVLTNTLVLLVMAWIAAGRAVSARLMLCVVISITCVGLIYHLLLAHLNPSRGLALASDHGLHTVVPCLTVAWWLLWGEKPALRWSDPLLWIIWPLVYSAYALARAEFSGFYPYPFLDLPSLGSAQLVTNLVSMALVFVVVGLALTGLGKVTVAARARAVKPRLQPHRRRSQPPVNRCD
jgi:hypothetical protein